MDKALASVKSKRNVHHPNLPLAVRYVLHRKSLAVPNSPEAWRTNNEIRKSMKYTSKLNKFY
jgi:hypothetical protein